MGENIKTLKKHLQNYFQCCGTSWCSKAKQAYLLWLLAAEDPTVTKQSKSRQSHFIKLSCATATIDIRRF
jgi:hypothetical protein